MIRKFNSLLCFYIYVDNIQNSGKYVYRLESWYMYSFLRKETILKSLLMISIYVPF